MELTDLHVHSNASDGTLSPTELVKLAKQTGLKAFALTDHDTTAGIPEALAAGKELGVEVIPGIEISTIYSSGKIDGKEIHIVGLFIDYEDEYFLSQTSNCRDSREGRNEKIIQKMNESGYDISMKELRELFGNDTVITRAHFAKWMVMKGIVETNNEAFDKYLGDGKPFCISRNMPDPAKAVELITSVGGVAVLAHPLLYKMNEEELVVLCNYLKRFGLKGIEGLYSSYTSGDEITVRRIANKCGLLISGGSDFHGANKPEINLGTGHGNLRIPYEFAVNLKKTIK